MKTDIVDVSETRKHLRVELPSELVDAEIGRVAARYGKAAKLPGFRPGKVPAKVVRQRFRGQILHDVAEHLIGHAVEDALAARGVQPVDAPDIQDLVIEEGHPLTFTAAFDVVPSFDPGDLSTIELRRQPVVVDEESVNQALEQLRERAARFEPVDGSAVDTGQTVVMDLVRRGTDKDGQRGEEDRHQQVSIELGDAANPPGFDDQLIGMSVGETKSFTLTYPNDYSTPDLAGSTVDYTVTIKELKRRVVPALDDEFAKDLGDFESLDALRARVRADLEAEAAEASERELRNDLLKKLSDRVPFAVPASLLDREVDRRVQGFARRLMDQRVDPRQTQIDWAAFRQGQAEPAADSVKSAMALDEIARRESLTVTEADMDAEFAKYAEGTGRSPAAIRARLQQDGELPRLAAGLRREKAVAWALGKARIVTI
ncbi:MAG: trigger factor [Acidobacteria bacterium]|nr:trigger factor [Acidobacteriota bacterium]